MAIPVGIGAALIGAGSSLFSSIFNGATSSNNAYNQYKYNSQLMQQQNDYNTSMWNMNNEYNTPSAQAQRYSDAGFNPALMMGQGNVSQLPSSVSGQSVSQQTGNYLDPNLGSQLANLFISAKQASADIKVKDAQANLLNAQATESQSNTNLNTTKQTLLNLQANWESMSQEDRLNQLKAITAKYEADKDLTNKQEKVIDKELPFIAQLKQAEFDSIMQSIKESKQRALSEAKKRLVMDSEIASNRAMVKQLEACTSTEELRQKLIHAQTNTENAKVQEMYIKCLKTVQETENIAQKNVQDRVKGIYLEHGWNPDRPVWDNVANYLFGSSQTEDQPIQGLQGPNLNKNYDPDKGLDQLLNGIVERFKRNDHSTKHRNLGFPGFQANKQL